MTRDYFFNNILSKRDYSGSSEDEYLQNLESFHLFSQLQNQEDDFLNLVEKSIIENKKINLDPAFEKEMENIDYDDIPLGRLILV
jgi:hypothetical protein